jgi:hypothetical protein
LHRHLTGRTVRLPWTRSRAYRKNDNAHCEQKNWTHVRQLFGHDRFAHPLVSTPPASTILNIIFGMVKVRGISQDEKKRPGELPCPGYGNHFVAATKVSKTPVKILPCDLI